MFPGSANQNIGASRKHPACARSLHPGYGFADWVTHLEARFAIRADHRSS